jgi:serine protease Do
LSDFFTVEVDANLYLGARFFGAPHPLSVRELQPNGPAYRAGLRVGQEVVEVNGKPVSTLAKLCKLVAASANRRAAITVKENGVRRVLNVELLPLAELNRELFSQRLGLITTPLTKQQATAEVPAGLLVGDVEKNSPAANAALQPGMIITEADGVAVGDLVNISNVLGNKKRGEIVRLTVKVADRYASGFVRWLSAQVDVPAR